MEEIKIKSKEEIIAERDKEWVKLLDEDNLLIFENPKQFARALKNEWQRQYSDYLLNMKKMFLVKKVQAEEGKDKAPPELYYMQAQVFAKMSQDILDKIEEDNKNEQHNEHRRTGPDKGSSSENNSSLS